ncbi:MAG: ABC transporter substrate-binding protein, partial [Planctomycetaceae bacterium]|nr:ABC transporter substrate-binding protein [Planctomycetaceae bacterium]
MPVERPQRIVATSATAVDIVAALVDPDRIAGFPVQALEYSSLHDEPPQFASIRQFEAYLAEPVLALRPDLVVIDPWQAPETSQRLREAGVSVLALPEVRGLEDAFEALRTVAKAVGE